MHFIGLALGLGGATLLDLMMLRSFLMGRIQSETFSIFEFSSKVIKAGLNILWITGLGFLMFYALFDVEKLYNQKLHSKLAVVAILIINGILIHSFILPSVKAQIGRALFEGLSSLKRSIFITSGAISAVSWYVPVALGTFSQLNNTVPATILLSGYFLLIVCLAFAMNIALVLVGSRMDRIELLPSSTWPNRHKSDPLKLRRAMSC